MDHEAVVSFRERLLQESRKYTPPLNVSLTAIKTAAQVSLPLQIHKSVVKFASGQDFEGLEIII